MMPTRTPGPASTPGAGDTTSLDHPVREVEAEPGTESGGPETFLLEVFGMVHGTAAGSGDAATPAAPVTARAERVRRRDRRRERQFARSVEQALAKGETAEPATEPETLAEYVARVDASLLPWRSRRSRPRTPRWLRRTAKVAAVGALLVACVAAPWVAPAVPGTLADLVPGHRVSHVEDPPVAPSSAGFTGPIGVTHQAGPLSGVRLKAAGQPREVVVPRLHVDSEVVPISGQSGSLLPPSDPQVLGWWKEGRWAGAGQGTAVITGHTVHTGGGALDHLDKLVVGDSLRVRTDHGWIRYVVQRARIYSTAQLARDADQIFRLDGPGRLVVITCDGWNGVSYDSNAIVIATPVADDASAG